MGRAVRAVRVANRVAASRVAGRPDGRIRIPISVRVGGRAAAAAGRTAKSHS